MKAELIELALFENHLINRCELAESSVSQYVDSVARFLATNPDIDDVSSYNAFLEKYSIRKRCYHYRSALKAFIKYKFLQSAQKSLIEGLVQPKMPGDYAKDRIHLSIDKLLEVVNNFESEKHKIVALIQLVTGVRAGDVLRLRYGRIMPEETKDGNVLRVNFTGKGKKLNSVFIFDEALQEMILSYVKRNSFVTSDYYFLEVPSCRHNRTKPLTEAVLLKNNYMQYWLDLKRALLKSGVDITLFGSHDFRRCFARRAWEMKKDVYRLQRLLNHADPKTTLRYLRQSGLENQDFHKEMQELQK